MPNPTYIPSELAPEVIKVGDKLHTALDEISEDNGIFSDISTAIQQKTGQVDPYDKDELASTILSEWVIPLEEKSVNFYNTNGTILYSYADEEAEALTELPAVPERDGYIVQGWTATLEQIKSAVEAGYPVNVGAMYITDDGATRLHLTIPEGVPLDFDLYTQINNGTLSVEIDGVEVASESESSSSFVNHTIRFSIPAPESYPYDVDISLKYTGSAGFHIGENTVGSRIFGWNSDQNDCLTGISFGQNITTITGYSFDYCNSLEEAIIPQGVTSIGTAAFQNCGSLKSVVIPQEVTSIGDGAFQSCTSLNNVVIPQGVTRISVAAFQNCGSLKSVVIPQGVTSIGNYAFSGCASLNIVVIPQGVTSIGASVFSSCSLLMFLDLTAITSVADIPTLSNVNALSGTAAALKIYVANQEMLEAFSTATNWSTYSSHFEVKT